MPASDTGVKSCQSAVESSPAWHSDSSSLNIPGRTTRTPMARTRSSTHPTHGQSCSLISRQGRRQWTSPSGASTADTARWERSIAKLVCGNRRLTTAPGSVGSGVTPDRSRVLCQVCTSHNAVCPVDLRAPGMFWRDHLRLMRRALKTFMAVRSWPAQWRGPSQRKWAEHVISWCGQRPGM